MMEGASECWEFTVAFWGKHMSTLAKDLAVLIRGPLEDRGQGKTREQLGP